MRKWARFSGCILVVLLLAVVGGSNSTRAADNPQNAFELEGDILDNPAVPANDWVNLNCPAIGGSSALVKTGVAHEDPLVTIFTQGGSKDKLDVSQWRYKDGSVPDKDDIVNAYAAQYRGVPDGETILVVGGDRFDVSGSAFIGAWFFHETVNLGPAGIFVDAAGQPATHTNGDLLILAEFSQGGTVATVKVFEWIGSPGPSIPCPPDQIQKGGTLCDVTTATSGTSVGFSNAAVQTIPPVCSEWPYIPKSGPSGSIPVNGFFEVGINLSTLGLGNECFATFMLETRSSFEVDAQLKDFVLHSFAPCEIECDKSVDRTEVCLGETTTYTYEVRNPGGVDLTVTARDDNETPDPATADDVPICMPSTSGGPCGAPVPPATDCPFVLPAGEDRSCTRTLTLEAGTHTNTLHVIGTPVGGSLELPCESAAAVTVNPNPTVTINTFTCNFSPTFTLTAIGVGGTPPYTYAWSTGDTTASITESVTGLFSVTLTDAKNCRDSACREVGFCAPGTPPTCP